MKRPRVDTERKGGKPSERALRRYLERIEDGYSNENPKAVLRKLERARKLAKPLFRTDDEQLRLNLRD